MLDAGSRRLPLPLESAPIQQQGKESIWSLLLLWSNTHCLLPLSEIVWCLNTYTARAAVGTSQSPLCCPPTRLSERYTALASSYNCNALLWEWALKPTDIKPYVDTSLELNQKLGLMLNLESFSLKSVFFRIGKNSSNIVVMAKKGFVLSPSAAADTSNQNKTFIFIRISFLLSYF